VRSLKCRSGSRCTKKYCHEVVLLFDGSRRTAGPHRGPLSILYLRLNLTEKMKFKLEANINIYVHVHDSRNAAQWELKAPRNRARDTPPIPNCWNRVYAGTV
jgi:hypothetical protein